jgi:hypothetical protein
MAMKVLPVLQVLLAPPVLPVPLARKATQV